MVYISKMMHLHLIVRPQWKFCGFVQTWMFFLLSDISRNLRTKSVPQAYFTTLVGRQRKSASTDVMFINNSRTTTANFLHFWHEYYNWHQIQVHVTQFSKLTLFLNQASVVGPGAVGRRFCHQPHLNHCNHFSRTLYRDSPLLLLASSSTSNNDHY